MMFVARKTFTMYVRCLCFCLKQRPGIAVDTKTTTGLGTYSKMAEGGVPCYVSRDLTGFPSLRVSVGGKHYSDRDELFTKLLDYHESGYSLFCWTPRSYHWTGHPTDPDPLFEAVKFKSHHCYIILGVFEVNEHRMLLIRDPSNNTPLRGAWHPSSPLWEEKPSLANLRKEFGGEHGENGLAWIPWEEVLCWFQKFSFCFVEKNWHDYRVATHVSPAGASVVLKITVSRWPVVMYAGITMCKKEEPNRNVRLGLAKHDPVTNTMQYTDFASRNPTAPATTKSVFAAHNLWMRQTLSPRLGGGAKTFFIVPMASIGTDAVLTLQTNRPVDDATFHVEFVSLPDHHAAFNEWEFNFTIEDGHPVAAPCQVDRRKCCMGRHRFDYVRHSSS